MAARPPDSSTRLYVGNLPRDVTKEEMADHLRNQGSGAPQEIKLMNGFGFVEYADPRDASDVIPNGSDFKGSRLSVQFARGPRPRDPYGPPDRSMPRPRRTAYRMTLTGLSENTSWQDLKDFARGSGSDVVYSEVSRDRDGQGYVEFETSDDLKAAVDKLDGREFRGATIRCLADEQGGPPPFRGRSRSPPRRYGGNGYGPPPGGDDYYDRRPPPRGYSPRGGRGYSPPRRDYDRRRSPPPPPRGRDDYYARGRYDDGGPPRSARGPPPDGYDAPPPPPRNYRDDGYGGPPPRRYEEPYGNGYGRPPRPASPPRRGYGGGNGNGGAAGGYEERRNYW